MARFFVVVGVDRSTYFHVDLTRYLMVPRTVLKTIRFLSLVCFREQVFKNPQLL
ncbi:MAG: hypothetical protein KC736_00585 [Candidatus Moranbacteria bacterium]|nr:hypothetical protein [Candidatus Moranbacteria bacterium]